MNLTCSFKFVDTRLECECPEGLGSAWLRLREENPVRVHDLKQHPEPFKRSVTFVQLNWPARD